MYPTLFHIGSFEITSVGAMVALACAGALDITRSGVGRTAAPDEVRETPLRPSSIAPSVTTTI